MVQDSRRQDFRDGSLHILALDPGGTTGWASYSSQIVHDPICEEWLFTNEQWTHGELGPGPHHKKLYDLLSFGDEINFHIVCESFEYRHNKKDSQRENIVLDSKEYIGVVKHFEQARLQEHGRVVFQTASEGKGFWFPKKDPAKLKKVGLYTPGSMHMNDATAHLLHYLTFKLKNQEYLKKLR